MGISRSTFARIVEQARRKVADALVHGRTLRVGSSVEMEEQRAADTAAPPRCERTGCWDGKRHFPGCESHSGAVAERENGAVPRRASKKQEVIT
jgi:hypothetical protein